MNDTVHTDMNLILELISPFFVRQMEEEHHKFLLPHFIVPFILFESAFRSMRKLLERKPIRKCSIFSESDYLLLPNGDYVDDEHLEKYYQNPDDKDDKRAKQASM